MFAGPAELFEPHLFSSVLGLSFLGPTQTAMACMYQPWTVYFEKNKAPFLNSKSIEVINQHVVAVMKEKPELNIQVDVHADPQEKNPSILTAKRAKIIEAYLQKNGISKDRMKITPYVSSRPVSPAGSERNGRAEFTPTLEGKIWLPGVVLLTGLNHCSRQAFAY